MDLQRVRSLLEAEIASRGLYVSDIQVIHVYWPIEVVDGNSVSTEAVYCLRVITLSEDIYRQGGHDLLHEVTLRQSEEFIVSGLCKKMFGQED